MNGNTPLVKLDLNKAKLRPHPLHLAGVKGLETFQLVNITFCWKLHVQIDQDNNL